MKSSLLITLFRKKQHIKLYDQKTLKQIYSDSIHFIYLTFDIMKFSKNKINVNFTVSKEYFSVKLKNNKQQQFFLSV